MSDKLIPTLQAQYRDLAKSQIVRAKHGTLDQAPGLPESNKENQKKLGGVIKMIEVKSI